MESKRRPPPPPPPPPSGPDGIPVADVACLPLLYRISGKRMGKAQYRGPSEVMVKKCKELFALLHAEKWDEAVALARGPLLDFNITQTQEDPHLYAFEAKWIVRTQISFFWRRGRVCYTKHDVESGDDKWVYPLVLSSPHEGQDGAGASAVDSLLRTRCRCLLLNAIHPDSGGDPKQGHEKPADGAHRVGTMFAQMHAYLGVLDRNFAFVQFHGMRGAPGVFEMLITACFHGNFTSKVRSIPRMLCDGMVRTYEHRDTCEFTVCSQLDGKYDGLDMTDKNQKPGSKDSWWFRSRSGCHNTNVNARQLNGGGQTNLGSHDAGRFVHLELAAHFRSIPRKRVLLARSIDRAMFSWIDAPYVPTDPSAPPPDDAPDGPENAGGPDEEGAPAAPPKPKHKQVVLAAELAPGETPPLTALCLDCHCAEADGSCDVEPPCGDGDDPLEVERGEIVEEEQSV